MASASPNPGRLSVDDWIQAGFAILAEDGPAGLEIDRLRRSPPESAHVVRESRTVIDDLLATAGASAHFLDNPRQRIKRHVGDFGSRDFRLRHQPGIGRRTDNGDADPTHSDGVTDPTRRGASDG